MGRRFGLMADWGLRVDVFRSGGDDTHHAEPFEPLRGGRDSQIDVADHGGACGSHCIRGSD